MCTLGREIPVNLTYISLTLLLCNTEAGNQMLFYIQKKIDNGSSILNTSLINTQNEGIITIKVSCFCERGRLAVAIRRWHPGKTQGCQWRATGCGPANGERRVGGPQGEEWAGPFWRRMGGPMESDFAEAITDVLDIYGLLYKSCPELPPRISLAGEGGGPSPGAPCAGADVGLFATLIARAGEGSGPSWAIYAVSIGALPVSIPSKV